MGCPLTATQTILVVLRAMGAIPSDHPTDPDALQRAAHIKDTADLIADIQNNTLPAVSVGKPDGLLDGHPQSSKIDLFEAYVENILSMLDKYPSLKATTAVFITWDEAGGYWDSGFVQLFDYFGDGTRIPLLVLCPIRPAA